MLKTHYSATGVAMVEYVNARHVVDAIGEDIVLLTKCVEFVTGDEFAKDMVTVSYADANIVAAITE